MLVVLLIGFSIPLSLTGWALFMKAHGKKNDEVRISRISYIDKFLAILIGFVGVPVVCSILGYMFGDAGGMLFGGIIGFIGAALFAAYKHYKLFNLTKTQGTLLGVLSASPFAYLVLAIITGGASAGIVALILSVWLFGMVYAVYWWLTYGRKMPPKASTKN